MMTAATPDQQESERVVAKALDCVAEFIRGLIPNMKNKDKAKNMFNILQDCAEKLLPVLGTDPRVENYLLTLVYIGAYALRHRAIERGEFKILMKKVVEKVESDVQSDVLAEFVSAYNVLVRGADFLGEGVCEAMQGKLYWDDGKGKFCCLRDDMTSLFPDELGVICVKSSTVLLVLINGEKWQPCFRCM